MNLFKLLKGVKKKSLILNFLACPDDFDISIKTHGKAIVITIVEKDI